MTLLSSCPFFLMKDDISSFQLRMESGKKVGELVPAETEEEVTFSILPLFLFLLHFSFPKSLCNLLLRKRSLFPTSHLFFHKKSFLLYVFVIFCCKTHFYNSELMWLFVTFSKLLGQQLQNCVHTTSVQNNFPWKLLAIFCDGY